MRTRRVVIDVYCELFVETLDAGPFKIGALDDEDRIVLTFEHFNVANRIGAGQTSIRRRNLTADDDLSRLAQGVQQPAKAERRSDAIAIRFDVRRDTKFVSVFN